jgi:hypothetical protein
MDRGVGSVAGATAEAEAEAGGRLIGPGLYKRGDKRTLVDLAELPEAMRRAGRRGPKPKRER